MSSAQRAFTIIELLVVMSISTLVISLAAGVAQDVVEGNHLTQAGEMVRDELRLARHAALTRNRVVEVRFYKSSNLDSFGDQPGITSLQTFIFDQDNAASTALRELRKLPGSVKVSEDATLSSLMTPERIKNDWKTGDEQIALPDAGSDYTAYRIRFLPDGSTDLDTQEQWFLTLHHRRATQSPPPNFVTIQVKPSRGTIRTFQP